MLVLIARVRLDWPRKRCIQVPQLCLAKSKRGNVPHSMVMAVKPKRGEETLVDGGQRFFRVSATHLVAAPALSTA